MSSRSFRKILWAVLEKMHISTEILTYWQWWNHRTPFLLEVGVQKVQKNYYPGQRSKKIMCSFISVSVNARKDLQWTRNVCVGNILYKQMIFEFCMINMPTFLHFSLSFVYCRSIRTLFFFNLFLDFFTVFSIRLLYSSIIIGCFLLSHFVSLDGQSLISALQIINV